MLAVTARFTLMLVITLLWNIAARRVPVLSWIHVVLVAAYAIIFTVSLVTLLLVVLLLSLEWVMRAPLPRG